MTKNKIQPVVLKLFFLLALSVCLGIGLYAKPVKSTVSYVTSLSETCANTFTGKETTEPVKPEEPSDPQEEPTGSQEKPSDSPEKPSDSQKDTSSKKTGDEGHAGWYVMLIAVSLVVIVIALRSRHKKRS